MAPAPQCGAVVTIAGYGLPSLKDAAGEDIDTLGRTEARWPSFLGLGMASWWKCYVTPCYPDVIYTGIATDGVGEVYGYVITDDSDNTAEDSTVGRIENCDDGCQSEHWCYNDECVPIDGMYFAMNFVGLTCDAIDIDIEGVMCDDAVIIEAHADHECPDDIIGGGCSICITTGVADGGDDESVSLEESSDSVLPGFSLIMAMCALLSAVIIRRRPE